MKEIIFNDIKKGDVLVVESVMESGVSWIFSGEINCVKDDVLFKNMNCVAIKNPAGVRFVKNLDENDWRVWPRKWFDDAKIIRVKRNAWRAQVLGTVM